MRWLRYRFEEAVVETGKVCIGFSMIFLTMAGCACILFSLHRNGLIPW